MTTDDNGSTIAKRKPGTFGSADGPDPSVSGTKSKRPPSLVAAIKKRIADDPSILPALADSMVQAASRGDATAVNALRTLLDRLDGPVAVQLDVRADTSRLLLQGETLDMIPAMPAEVALLEQDADGSYSADPDATE